METKPEVGDVWQGEALDGSPIFRTVTAVLPPSGCSTDWQICLDGSTPSHLGWWWGQGWAEVE